jgi:pre-mRNA cleavage complex 2 protein Pcf11
MSGLISDEIAEDYKSSLEDLTTNDGIQIRTLTVIAKENTEHAMAISRVLENHIRTTPPLQKLPALYVADSIVKNVGSPYTLFLGRNMYQTFMNVYTLVDGNTRRKLDEMLNTWKQPAPGSLDTRPVFPPDITRNIETALIKARTAALQQQQARAQPDILGRSRGNVTPTGWTNSSTPQNMPRPSQNHPTNGSNSAPPQTHRHDIDLSYLNRDVDALIASAKIDFANSPFNPVSQQRLKALVDLQAILQKQQLAPDQLKLVRDQVSALAATRPPSVAPNTATNASAVPAPQIPTPPAQPVSQPLHQLLNHNTLAELIKATASRQQSTPPPQIPAVLPQMPQYPHQTGPSQPATENPLIAALRARGLLPGGPTPSPLTPSASTPVSGRSNLPFILPHGMQPTPPAPSQPAIPSNGSSGVPMSTASMKIPRFGLIVSLYDSRPNRCGTCGRRFLTTDQGKEMKARHLDWHFKTNQRMTESSRRAQNRSWYVDERDWIKSREAGDVNGAEDPQATAEGSAGVDGNTKQEPPKPWIRAPNDATLRNTPCPICQEKFESTWSEDVQDWIWQDATKVGSRVYHASCYSEVTKGPAPTRQTRTSTPDSVLGKRKAEVSFFESFKCSES